MAGAADISTAAAARAFRAAFAAITMAAVAANNGYAVRMQIPKAPGK